MPVILPYFAPQPQVSSASPLPSAAVGRAYNFTLTAYGGAGPPYAWTMLSDTPDTGSWLTLNPATGKLTGTPGTAEIETIQVQAADAIGTLSPPATFQLIVNAAGGAPAAPTNIWPGLADSAKLKFSLWPSGDGTADSYSIYRTDISTTTPIKTGIVQVSVFGGAVPQIPYEDYPGNPDTAAFGATLNPNTSYSYFATATTGGVESAPTATLTMTTLPNGPGATLPTLPTDPATYDPGPPALPTGTTWTCTNTASTAVTGTGTLGNVGCSIGWALGIDQGNVPRMNINGGDILIATAGLIYPAPGASGYTIPAFTGTNGVTYITTSEDPLIKAGGQLIPYSVVTNYAYTAVPLTATLLAAGATTGTLAANWTGRSAYFPCVFYTNSLANFESRLVHFVNGSNAISWNAPLKGAATQTVFLVMSENFITPDDVATSMPTIQFSATNGNGISITAPASNVRFVGINIAPAPGAYTTNSNGSSCVVANDYPFPNDNPNYTSIANKITFDRCCFGNDPTGANYSYVKRGIDAIGNTFVTHQCFLYGFYSGVAGGDTQGYYCQGGGPHLLRNTFLWAGAENFFTGGVYTPQPQIPHDVTIRYCYSIKDGGINGTALAREYKNHFETKIGQRFHFHDNVFQDGWYSFAGAGQNGRVGQMGPLDQQSGKGSVNLQSLTWSAGVGTCVATFLGPVPVGTKFQTTFSQITPAAWNVTVIGTITTFNRDNSTFTFSMPTNPGANGSRANPSVPMQMTNIVQATNPWSIVSDGTVENNKCYGFAQPFYFHTESLNLNQSGKAMRFLCRNNQIWLNPAATDNNGTTSLIRGLQVSPHTPDVTFDHNTVIEIPQNTGYLSAGSGFYTSGCEFFSQTPVQALNFGYIDRCVVTNNYLDGGRGFSVSFQGSGSGYQGQGTAAITQIMRNPTFSNNAMVLDASNYSPYLPNTNPVTYANSGFANFTANTFMPQSPSDWNITSGALATASTTGGPIGSTF